MSHLYDGHAEQCFGIQENRNKEILPNMKGWLGLNSLKRLVQKILIKSLISDNSLIPIESPIKKSNKSLFI